MALATNPLTANPLNDPSSPYFMHPNENPGAILVSAPLTGGNYHSWSRSMTMALKSKNKIQFIDGTLPKLPANHPLFAAWDRCNTLVLSWINQALDPSIVQSVLWLETAYEVWQDLKERYYQGDIFRICDLQEDLYGIRQGTLSISDYYTQLKGLWQELDNFRPIPACSCEVKCTCNLIPVIKSYRENDYVIRFLKGLNEQYSSVRSHIMLIEPLPSINKVFSMLMQQERQFNGSYDESRILTNNTEDSTGRGRTRGRGRNSSPGILGRGRGSFGRGNNGTNSNKICTYCNRTGHTVDVCYRKHGFPPSFRRGNNINNINTAGDDTEDSNNAEKIQDTGSEQGFMPFTLDQQQAIMSMIKQNDAQTGHSANQITSCIPRTDLIEDDWCN